MRKIKMFSKRIHVKYKSIVSGNQSPASESALKLLSTLSPCLANFGVQYNFQSIGVALLVMSAEQCTSTLEDCINGKQQPWVTGTISAVVFLGAICGQLSMGVLGDYISRNNALSITLLLSAISVLLSSIAPTGRASSVYATIIVCRFFAGVGLGGIYPLSATKASEDSAHTAGKTNSSGSAFAFVWQIPGMISPWLLAWIFTHSDLSVDRQWRLLLGLGAIPLFLAILCLLLENHLRKEPFWCCRHRISLAARGAAATEPDIEADASSYTGNKTTGPTWTNGENLQKLFASGVPWFLYNLLFYGLSLLGGTVLRTMSNGDDHVTSVTHMRSLCSQQTVALTLGILPMALNLILLPRLSLKYLQLCGFLVQAFFFALFVCFFSYLKAHNARGLFSLYCMVLMSLQVGVPVTTFALPAVLFEKKIRTTYNGIAAAMGKTGAIFGACSFYFIARESLHAVLIICVVVAILGAFVTHYYILDSALINDNASTQGSASEEMVELNGAIGTEMDVSVRSDSSSGSNKDEEGLIYRQVSFE